MKPFILFAALVCAMATGATAAPRSELSAPIVAYTPVIVKNAEALELTAEQRADLKAWMATMPAKRMAKEAEAIALRAQLRAAINTGALVAERQALAEQIGTAETELLMMRSGCVDHWREVLSPAQFAKVLEIAAQR
ncbi:hypothetical protein [Thalassovita taeanensis]|uniref:LTXXQ motif family protein n=1 Tax=Thalassovita taeanensis TaxID=657014 RepID=A0A1H9CSB9_9RHOB|nr:hypothetical protein [Thalassovita taeanensis]SEQ03503.1 hypothetical protein SAMN04488092_103352 [Thalassovita taeanensis]